MAGRNVGVAVGAAVVGAAAEGIPVSVAVEVEGATVGAATEGAAAKEGATLKEGPGRLLLARLDSPVLTLFHKRLVGFGLLGDFLTLPS
jgi:hypothetical protein